MGLIQRAIEEQGIRTAGITHLPKVTDKISAPRSLHINFPLGSSFGQAGAVELQKEILWDAIQFAITGEPESILKVSY